MGSSPASAETATPRSLVIFESRPESRWLRWLKRGFQHCFCLIEAERGWVLVDPLLAELRVTWLDLPDDFDLVGHYRRQGRHVAAGRLLAGTDRNAGLCPVTCVELVRRAVGLRRCRVWTPWQLAVALVRHGWRLHEPC